MAWLVAILSLAAATVIDDEFQPSKIVAQEILSERRTEAVGEGGIYSRSYEHFRLVSSKTRDTGAVDTFLQVEVKHVFRPNLTPFQGFERANFRGGQAADFDAKRAVELCTESLCGVTENLSVRLTHLPGSNGPIELRFYDADGGTFDLTIDSADLSEHLRQVHGA